MSVGMHSMTSEPDDAVLSVRGLSIDLTTDAGRRTIIHGIDFDLDRGQTLTLVGESGSGKTMTAEALIGMVSPGVTSISSGQVTYRGEPVIPDDGSTLAELRGTKVCLVPQDPLSALNPSFTVGWQIGEVLRRRLGMSRRAAKQQVLELLDQVQIDRPELRYSQFPHQLSGGMRQRVLIAQALAPEPDVLLLDEPTTALDVSVEAQVLELLRDLQRDRHMAMMLVTHDLGVAAVMSDDIAVMYAGRIVEKGPAHQVLQQPRHPYTQGLLRSIPRLTGDVDALDPIPGEPPELGGSIPGCPFAARCGEVISICLETMPALLDGGSGTTHTACHRRRVDVADARGGSR